MGRHTNSPLCEVKAHAYYDSPREDILVGIRDNRITARRVLELGCASGTASRELKRMLQAEWYVGIELCAQAAEKARGLLDQVHVADIQAAGPGELGLAENDFDLLAAIDVLEHLRDPWETLARWVTAIKRGGWVILSIPNVQNISVVAPLIQGGWNYTQEGLLDATHLRFFTEQSIGPLIAGAGLKLERLQGVPGPSVDLSRVRDRDNCLEFGGIKITGLSRQQVVLMHVFQFIVIARRC